MISAATEANIRLANGDQTNQIERSMPVFPGPFIAPFEEWYDLHRDSPYPSASKKLELASAAGMSVAQVDNWFYNKRSGEKKDSQFLYNGRSPMLIT
jgi:hypothetical protein